MKVCRLSALLLPLFAASLFAAPLPTPRDALPGKWKIVSCEENGRQRPQLVGAHFLFQGTDRLSLVLPDGQEEKYILRLDPAQKPHALDFWPPRNPEAALQGIYEVNGDDLKLCFANFTVGKRPTEFQGKERHVFLILLKREKP
jgi:uncharacterized protein (TIGR03067 family)